MRAALVLRFVQPGRPALLLHPAGRRPFATAPGPRPAAGPGPTWKQTQIVAELEARAAAGDVNAMCALGSRLAVGRLGPSDAARGQHWLQKAAAQGHAAAMLWLGRLSLGTGAGPIGLAEARRAEQHFKDAGAKGLAVARTELARLYLGTPASPRANPQAGLALLQAEAAAGSGSALYELHRLSADPAKAKAHGLDPAAAPDLLLRAAEAGNPSAQCTLGLRLLSGADGAKDEARGRELLRQAAKLNPRAATLVAQHILQTRRNDPAALAEAKQLLGFPAARGSKVALYHLGEVYFREKDFANATRLFRMVVDTDSVESVHHHDALCKLGRMALVGWAGVPANPAQAVSLFTRAAARSVVAAQQLGLILLYGRHGIERNVDRAEAALRQADHLLPMALTTYTLGVLYHRHRSDTPEGAHEAVALLQRAADQGFGAALASLATIYTKGLPGIPADAAKAAELLARAQAFKRVEKDQGTEE